MTLLGVAWCVALSPLAGAPAAQAATPLACEGPFVDDSISLLQMAAEVRRGRGGARVEGALRQEREAPRPSPEPNSVISQCNGKRMQLWINYFITLVAVCVAAWYYCHRDEKSFYRTAMLWHIFVASSALLGGTVHTIHAYPEQWHGFCGQFGLDPATTANLMWFFSMISLIIADYFIVSIFFKPYMNQEPKVDVYMKFSVVFGIALQIFGNFGVVIAHLMTHLAGIVFAVQLKCWTVLPILCVNIGVVVVYALMSEYGHCLIPSGPLHHNDWYHGYAVCIQLYLFYFLAYRRDVDDLYTREEGGAEDTDTEPPALPKDVAY